tara:strand:- start:139 stop:369 length:231 start_codon:yes stop_codon:yes gene_type:complete
MIRSETLLKGQRLRIELTKVKDRLPVALFEKLKKDPNGVWNGGYKMVDGNAFGLVLELNDGTKSWFFENELSEINS